MHHKDTETQRADHKGTLLVVDDTPANLKLLVDTLSAEGFRVLPADSGELALAAAAARPPDLILLDIRMPGLDGFEVCRRLKARAECRDIPIIFISAFGESTERAKGFELGAVDFLSKPIQPEEMLARVQTHLELRRLRVRAEQQAADLRQANEHLQRELAERQRSEATALALSKEIHASYLATLNLMDDAVEARNRLEGAIQELQGEIVERRRAEETLSVLSARQEAILAAVPDIIMEVDNRKVYTWANQAGLTFFGDDVVGKEAAFYFEGEQAIYQSVQPLFDGRQDLIYVESRQRRKDGEKRLLAWQCRVLKDDLGNVFGALSSGRDITEQKQMEEALADEATRRRILTEQSSDGIVVLDRDGKVFEANRRYADMLGYSPDEVRQLHVWDWDTQWSRAQLIEMIQAVDTAGAHFETRHRRKDGTVCDVDVSTNGAICGGQKLVFCVCRDITDRKRTEEAMRVSLREKEALLREVHHRVKNNLQVISSLLRLEAGRTTAPATAAVLNDMKNRIRSMALLHETLYRSENFAEVDMAAYLRQLANQLFRALNVNADAVQLVLELTPARLEIDQAIPCGLIANELASNSLKHGFPGGRHGEVRMELQPVAGGPQLRLRVSDDGVGLPANFDLARSNSLGLQLVGDLTRQLRGKLDVSPPGPGAVFTVTFTPRQGSEAVAKPPRPSQHPFPES